MQAELGVRGVVLAQPGDEAGGGGGRGEGGGEEAAGGGGGGDVADFVVVVGEGGVEGVEEGEVGGGVGCGRGGEEGVQGCGGCVARVEGLLERGVSGGWGWEGEGGLRCRFRGRWRSFGPSCGVGGLVLSGRGWSSCARGGP